MTKENSSNEEDNLRLWKNLREEVAYAAELLKGSVLQAIEGNASDKDVTREAIEFKNGIAKLREIEILIAKHSDQFGSGERGATSLDLDSARAEVLDRLVKVAASRRGGDISG